MTSLFEKPVGWARVAVERGIDRYPDGLTYAVPEPLADLVAGERVLVPLGRGNAPTGGYVVERVPAPEVNPDRVKFITGRDDASHPLPADLLDLARWMSRYYATPIGMCLASIVPSAVKRRVGRVSRTFVDLAPDGDPDAARTKQQRAVVEVLRATAAEARPIEMRQLAGRAGLKTTGPVRRLVDAGVLTTASRTSVEAAWAEYTTESTTPARLTDEQRVAVDAIAAELDAGFSVHLLRGVTGSGKTEVYLQLIERIVARDRVALVLVPEIALTPQTGGRLLGRLGHERVGILHSGLTAAQRHQQWAMIADGTARVVIGARSAVFAPVPAGRVGLIVVDEEHDSSYKQDQAPRYHGRDVAIKRAQHAGCPVVLGSATPSLESWHNAGERGLFRLHELTKRVPGMEMPVVRVVDLGAERRAWRDQGQRGDRLIGPTLDSALRRCLDQGDQAIILLNRRGYANYIACANFTGCGWVMQCDDCDVSMVFHRDRALPSGGFVRCHHCDAQQRLPRVCPTCDTRVTTLGLGTQRVEEELERQFGVLDRGKTLRRVDSDTMRSGRDFHALLDEFGRGTIRVLLGTQMIAKGLDFPRVRVVGVVNADTSLSMPDFRATERTFQLVSQVAGRGGRGAGEPATVVVQSMNPEEPAIRLAARHDYLSFAARELEERRASGMPPYTRLARIVVRDRDHEKAETAARTLHAAITRAALETNLHITEAAPCAIARVSGYHRWDILLRAADAGVIQQALTAVRNDGTLRPGMHVAVDVDPVSLL